MRGDWQKCLVFVWMIYFYSRPCVRGDYVSIAACIGMSVFLLTPLREGRLNGVCAV